MTDPVPDMESLESQVDRLARFIMGEIPGEPSQSQGAVDTAIRLLRDYQRVLAENEDLKAHEARWTETVERQRKTLDRYREERTALEAEVAALRADAQRWRFVRSRGMVAVNEDDEPCFCAWLRESEIPDTLHPSVMEGGGTKDPEQLDDVVDAARSGGEGEG